MEKMWTIAWVQDGIVFTERAPQIPAAAKIHKLREQGIALGNILALPPGDSPDPQELFGAVTLVRKRDTIYHFAATKLQDQSIWTICMAVGSVTEISSGIAVLHGLSNSNLTHLYLQDVNRIFHVEERMIWGYASGEMQSSRMACRAAAVLLAEIPAADCGAVSTLTA